MKKILSISFIALTSLVFAQKYTKDEVTFINQGNIKELLPIYQTTEQHQHHILLQKSNDVMAKNPTTKLLVERMKRSLESTSGGVGIAAPQVGVNRNVILVKRFDKEGTPIEYFLNPVILWKSQIQNLGPEGDLSIPIFSEQFYRSKVIQLQYQDLQGKTHTEMVEGFTAVIFQHEIDHLFGILIEDKLKKEQHLQYHKNDAYEKAKKKKPHYHYDMRL